jgi:type VI protein secretion system component Hcp
MKTTTIARVAAMLSVLAITAIAAPAFADVYFLEVPSSGQVGPEPTTDLTNAPRSMFKVSSFVIGPPTSQSASGKLKFGAMTVKGVDSGAAATLFQDAINQTELQQARLIIGKMQVGKLVPYQIYLMTSVAVTSTQVNGTSSGITDTFKLNYIGITYEQAKLATVKPGDVKSLSAPLVDSWARVSNLAAP